MTEIITLGHEQMDNTHQELIDILSQPVAYNDIESVTTFLDQIINHTTHHFESEEKLMAESHFPHYREHIAEHNQIINELKMMRRRLKPHTIPLIKSYIEERLPDWLEQHLQRIDSLLAGHLNET